MSDERDPRINDLVGYAVNKNPVEFQTTFNDIVTDRLLQSVTDRKHELAQGVFSGPNDPEDDELEDTEVTPDDESEDDSEEEEQIDDEDA